MLYCLANIYTLPLTHCKEDSYTKMQKETKTAQVNLRIAPSLKEAAEKAAADDQRSLTSLIEKLLTDYLRDMRPQKRP